MDVRVGDKLIMKKNHPCGSNEFSVLRIGMDFRIRCLGCGCAKTMIYSCCATPIRTATRSAAAMR